MKDANSGAGPWLCIVGSGGEGSDHACPRWWNHLGSEIDAEWSACLYLATPWTKNEEAQMGLCAAEPFRKSMNAQQADGDDGGWDAPATCCKARWRWRGRTCNLQLAARRRGSKGRGGCQRHALTSPRPIITCIALYIKGRRETNEVLRRCSKNPVTLHMHLNAHPSPWHSKKPKDFFETYRKYKEWKNTSSKICSVEQSYFHEVKMMDIWYSAVGQRKNYLTEYVMMGHSNSLPYYCFFLV